MKALITGGAGFIGSHLADRLLKEQHHTTVFDNLSTGNKKFIPSDAALIQADLIHGKMVDQATKDSDCIFHIAANPNVRAGADNPSIAQKDINSTYNVLEAMRKNDIEQIVFSSSSAIYGETPPQPLSEDYGPLTPISVYGASKLAAEGLITAFCGTYGMQSWIYRFANVVGTRGTHGVIVDFIQKLQNNQTELEILGNGKQRKPYLYIDDCIDAMMHGFNKANKPINIYNIGPHGTTDVTRIADIITKEMDLEDVTYNYTGGDRGWKGDVPAFQFDITKLTQLGWKPTYSSDEAVRKATNDVLQMNKAKH